MALIEGVCVSVCVCVCVAILKLLSVLSPVKEVPIPTGYETRWNTNLVLKLWRKEILVRHFIREINHASMVVQPLA